MAEYSSLSDEFEHQQQSEIRQLPRPDQDISLESAIAEHTAGLPADGKGDGDENSLDHYKCFELLGNQARESEFLFEGLQPDVLGGREHDLIYDESSSSVLKFTKPMQAAFTVDFWQGHPKLRPATPLQYLHRQLLHNLVFADTIQFVGLGGPPDQRRIITRQAHIKGEPASWERIKRFMIDELGFQKLIHNYGIGYEDSYAFIRDDIAVFDMRPPNVIWSGSDVAIPIDSIPVKLSKEALGFFLDQKRLPKSP